MHKCRWTERNSCHLLHKVLKGWVLTVAIIVSEPKSLNLLPYCLHETVVASTVSRVGKIQNVSMYLTVLCSTTLNGKKIELISWEFILCQVDLVGVDLVELIWWELILWELISREDTFVPTPSPSPPIPAPIYQYDGRGLFYQ